MTVYAAAVSFWAVISLVPLSAMVVFGVAIFTEAATVESFIDQMSDAVPGQTVEVITTQIRTWTNLSRGISTVGLVVAVVVSGWGASSGLAHTIRAINVAYGLTPRPFVNRRVAALGHTVAALILVIPIVILVAATPAALEGAGVARWVIWVISVVRWPVVIGLFVVVLGALYWAAPAERRPFRIFTPGIGAASVVFLIVSIGFSVYAANVDRYDENYGSLATVVVTMLWTYLTISALLLGAEVDAANEAAKHDRPHTDKGEDLPESVR